VKQARHSCHGKGFGLACRQHKRLCGLRWPLLMNRALESASSAKQIARMHTHICSHTCTHMHRAKLAWISQSPGPARVLSHGCFRLFTVTRCNAVPPDELQRPPLELHYSAHHLNCIAAPTRREIGLHFSTHHLDSCPVILFPMEISTVHSSMQVHNSCDQVALLAKVPESNQHAPVTEALAAAGATIAVPPCSPRPRVSTMLGTQICKCMRRAGCKHTRACTGKHTCIHQASAHKRVL